LLRLEGGNSAFANSPASEGRAQKEGRAVTGIRESSCYRRGTRKKVKATYVWQKAIEKDTHVPFLFSPLDFFITFLGVSQQGELKKHHKNIF
jgi:hypothetical protein